MRRLEVLSRVMVTVGVVFASMSVALPAWSSGGGPAITWLETLATSPVDVSGTVTVRATVTSATALDLITSVKVELVDADGKALATLCTHNTPRDRVDIRVHWNTTRGVGTPADNCDGTVGPGSGLAPNGRTRVRISAVQNVLTDDASTHLVDVWNTPGAPLDVASAFSASSQAFTVTWKANEEPDLSGYVVQQCHRNSGAPCPDSAWQDAATVNASSNAATVPVDKAGTYRFRVAAQRPGASRSVLQSDWSGSTAPVVLRDDDDDDGDPEGGDRDPGGGDEDPERDKSPDGGGGGGDGAPNGTGPGQSPSRGSLVAVPSAGGGDGGTGGGSRPGEASRTVVSTAEGGRGLPPRLVKRSDAGDGGYEAALPYGSGAGDVVDDGPFALLSAERGPALAVVPLAGGLVALVFGLQMRYLSRRAEALVAAEAAGAPSPAGVPGASGPLPVDGSGSFVEHWRRWLRPDGD